MGSPQKHADICQKLNGMYIRKNTAYGDSFADTYAKLGLISAVTRMTDKINRLQYMATNPNADTGNESIIDTCLDLANYAIMTAMEVGKDR